MTCDEIRLSLGALALGSLDEAEATVIRGHLDGCDECTREHDEFRGLPRLLGLVMLDEIADDPPAPSPGARVALLDQVAMERRRERRNRLLRTIGGGLAVAAAAATVGVVLSGGQVTAAEPDMTLHATDQGTGVDAEVALNSVGWGTKIALELSGVAAGETCRLVAKSADGDEVAGTWRVPSDVTDYITIPGAVGTELDRIDSFDVISSDGETLVHIPYDHTAAAASH